MSLGAGLGLESSVLVLNKHYMAVRVIGARRAFCLLCKSLAEVLFIDEGTYRSYDFEEWCEASRGRRASPGPDIDLVRTVRFPVEVPRIIRLLAFERAPRQLVKLNRRNVFARDGHRCQYCGRRPAAGHFSLDHVTPRSRGGPNTWENVVCACLACNNRKGGRTPSEAGMPLVREPARPLRSPGVSAKLEQRRYESWRPFLDRTPWTVDLS
jgi:5-methylcytosine-specific restriction endonuclease McrA